MGDIVCGQLKRPYGKYVESTKELFMKNQSGVDGSASPEPQPMIDTGSKNIGGQGPVVDALTSTPLSADIPSQGGPQGLMEPDSVKGGHD